MSNNHAATQFETELAEATKTARTVMIHQDQEPLIGQVKRVLITEGVLAWEMATALKIPGLVVAGLQSPTEWLATNGAPHSDLDRLVATPDAEVTIAFAGTQTKATVWTEADRLGKYLSASAPRGSAIKVRFAVLSGFPLETTLESKSDEQRAAYIEALVGKAGTIGRRPAADKAEVEARESIAPVVDLEEAITYLPHPERNEVLMQAAVHRTRTHRIYDDLKAAATPDPTAPALSHDLEVVVQTESGLRTHKLRGIPDDLLEQPRQILNRIPAGSGIEVATGNSVGRDIGLAIRSFRADQVPEDDILHRTGWAQFEGRWGYITPAGFMTAAGMSNRARCTLSPRLSSIATVDVTPGSALERDAAENTVSMFMELADTNLWAGPWGAVIHNVAGLGTKAVPIIHGKKGSGKSTVAEMVAAHLSPHFQPGGQTMATADATASNLGKLGIGLHNCFVNVDDSRERESDKRAEIQEEGIERLIRLGYGGGSARFATSEYNAATKTWGEGLPDLASPTVIIIGEQLPAAGEAGASSRERMWPSAIPEGFNIFNSGNSILFEEMACNGLPQVHLSGFIRWVASQIEEQGMDGWVARWEAVETAIVDGRSSLPVSRRVREVAAVIECGVRVWVAYLVSIGADKSTLRTILEAVNPVITAVALDHGTINVTVNTDLDSERILDSLRASVAGRGAFIRSLAAGAKDVDQYDLRRRMLGQEVRARGTEGTFLALIPREVLAVLHQDSRFKKLSERDLLRAFQGLSITDGSGKLTKTATIAGQRIKTLAIPTSLWDGESDDELGMAA